MRLCKNFALYSHAMLEQRNSFSIELQREPEAYFSDLMDLALDENYLADGLQNVHKCW